MVSVSLMAVDLFQFPVSSWGCVIKAYNFQECIGNSDGDGVRQGPDRKQIAHLSGVAEQNLVTGTFAKV